MIESYAIGISIAIESNPTTQLREIGEQFDLLTQTIKRTQTAVTDLSGALTGIEKMGGAAAKAWSDAAEAIDRAAAAARQAGTARPSSTMMPPLPPSAAPATAPAAPPTVTPPPPAAPPSAGPALPPPAASGRALGSAVSPATGFLLQGQPYSPYGAYPPGGAAPGAMPPAAGGAPPNLPPTGGAGGGTPPNLPVPGGPNAPGGGFLAPAPAAPGQARQPGGFPPLNLPPGLLYSQRGPMPANHDLAMASIGFGAVSGMLLSGVKTSINTAMSVDDIRGNLIGQGFSPKEADQAVELARRTQVNVEGSSLKGNLELVSKAMAVTQHADQAMQLMPVIARYGVALDAFGHQKEGAELMDALLAGDFRGIFQRIDPKTGKEEFDLSKLIPFLQNITIADFQTHGIINPGRFLQFMRSGGAAARLVSDEFMFADSIALQMAMGSSRAGTGLNALTQQFSSGKMSNAALSMLQDMGIIKQFDQKHPPEDVAKKLGFGQWQLLPNAFTTPEAYELARHDQTAFVMDFIGPRLQQWVVKAYQQQIAGRNLSEEEKQNLLHEDLIATWPALASRIPGGKLGAEIEGNYPLILRDRDARLRAMGYDPITHQRVGPPRDYYQLEVQNNPTIRVKAAAAALESLEYVLGERLMKTATDSLNDLSTALNTFAKVADDHKTLTRWLMDGAVAVGALAGGLGMLTGALFLLRPMGSVFKWLAPGLFDAAGAFKLFAPGTAAAAGMGVLGKSLGTLAGLFGAFELSKGLKSATDSAGDWVGQNVLGMNPDVQRLQKERQDYLLAHPLWLMDRKNWEDPNASILFAQPKLPQWWVDKYGHSSVPTQQPGAQPSESGGLLHWFHDKMFGPSASQAPGNFHAGTAAGVYAPALNMLAQSEGTDKGRGYNETYARGKYTGGPVDLTGKTIAQVEALQAQMIANHAPSTAVGRYQIIDTTMADLVRRMHLDPNTTKFSPDVQDQMGIALLRQAGVDDYRSGKLSQSDFQHNVARIWASVPDPAKGGASYYGQRVGIGMDDAAAQLEATRNLAAQIAPSLPPPPPPANDAAPASGKRADAGPLSWLIPSAQAETLPPAAPNGSRAASLLDLARPIPQANDNADRPWGNSLAALSAAPTSTSQPITVHSNLYMDGRRVAQAVSDHQADQLTRPPSGPTQPNLKLTPGYVSAIPAFGGT